MFSDAEEQTYVKAMCCRGGRASPAATPIEVLSGLEKSLMKEKAEISFFICWLFV